MIEFYNTFDNLKIEIKKKQYEIKEKLIYIYKCCYGDTKSNS